MAQEHVPGLPGGVRRRHAQSRRPPELGAGVGTGLAVGRQDLRADQVRTGQQPGRRVVAADIGELDKRQQVGVPGPAPSVI